MSRPRGRPRLDPDNPSAQVMVKLPSKQYDRLYAVARQLRVSPPEVVRRVLKAALTKTDAKP